MRLAGLGDPGVDLLGRLGRSDRRSTSSAGSSSADAIGRIPSRWPCWRGRGWSAGGSGDGGRFVGRLSGRLVRERRQVGGAVAQQGRQFGIEFALDSFGRCSRHSSAGASAAGDSSAGSADESSPPSSAAKSGSSSSLLRRPVRSPRLRCRWNLNLLPLQLRPAFRRRIRPNQSRRAARPVRDRVLRSTSASGSPRRRHRRSLNPYLLPLRPAIRRRHFCRSRIAEQGRQFGIQFLVTG